MLAIKKVINGYNFEIEEKFYSSLNGRQANPIEEGKVELTRVVLEYELIPQIGYPRIPEKSAGKYIDLNDVKNLEELEKEVRKNFIEPPWSKKRYVVTGQKKMQEN